MTWWAWVLLWSALVLGAAGVTFLIGRDLWRKAVALFRELGTASDRLAVLEEELGTLAERSRDLEEPAVFADPVRLRQERARTGRTGSARGRR